MAHMMSEGLLEAGPVRNARYSRNVVSQRNRWERPLANDHRMHKFDSHMLRISTRTAVAKHDQFATAMKPLSHRMTRARNPLGIFSEIEGRRAAPRQMMRESRPHRIAAGGNSNCYPIFHYSISLFSSAFISSEYAVPIPFSNRSVAAASSSSILLSANPT